MGVASSPAYISSTHELEPSSSANVSSLVDVGVDPFSGGNIRMKSDDFFLQNKQSFDCIFIDGLHEYDQVCKDLENSLNCVNEKGIIFFNIEFFFFKYNLF